MHTHHMFKNEGNSIDVSTRKKVMNKASKSCQLILYIIECYLITFPCIKELGVIGNNIPHHVMWSLTMSYVIPSIRYNLHISKLDLSLNTDPHTKGYIGPGDYLYTKNPYNHWWLWEGLGFHPWARNLWGLSPPQLPNPACQPHLLLSWRG